MAQYNPEMYNYAAERSPGSTRGGGSLFRAPSRHFDNSYSSIQQGLYTAEDHAQRYEPAPRFDTHRMTPAATLHSYNHYDNQTWNYGGAGGGSMMGGTGRIKPTARRPGLPNGWMGEAPPMPHSGGGANSLYQLNGNFNAPAFQQSQRRSSPSDASDELIPTALVIKNIPFAVKKEMILQIMTDMSLPLPYAFNYHFDQGVFRGLAFANFSSADETKVVIEQMNHLELAGRKLRVEYKKMLPIEERERIERDKREKRGQLEEQHRPIPPGQVNALHNQASMTSIGSNNIPVSPSPISIREKTEIDLNDPTTLGYYTELMMFKNDANRETLIFPPTVPPADRRIIHILAHNMGLNHHSEGHGDSRCVQILKGPLPAPHVSPPLPTSSYYNETRRGLNRAATIDFSETREQNSYHNHTLGRQGSGLLDIPGSPGLGGLSAAHNLRAAKSFADLRSYTPSPVPSAASFPVGLSQNIARYTDYAHSSAASGTPNLTPTSAGGLNARDETFLLNGLNGLSVGFDRANGNRNLANGRIGQERENHGSNTGPIGSQRPLNGSKQDEATRNGTIAERQPRGPGQDWGAGGGFSRPRQNGHANKGSGELDLNSFDNGWDDNRAQDPSDRNGTISSKSINRYK